MPSAPSPGNITDVADALLGALVAGPFIVFELLRVFLEMVDDNERAVEEARVSDDEARSTEDEVQIAVDNDEEGAAVMRGEPHVDCGAADSEVDTE